MENNKLLPGEKYFQEVRTTTFRKEEYSYLHTGIIDEDGETWTTTEMDEANIFQVYNQYRVKHGIPFPDEISAIREHYGLSAAKMAQILGFGINQYRMYEDGEVPSVSNARTIIAAREKDVFMSFVEASKSEMSEQEYLRTKKKVESVNGDYKPIVQPSEYTGFRSLSLNKTANVVRLIISTIGPTFVTKMNKMLFYADFIHYKNHGYGITGITYKALPFGPVPEHWGTLYSSLPGIDMEEFVYPSGQSGIKLEATENTDNILNESEIRTIEKVCSLFSKMSAGEISQTSHLEKGWIENKDNRSAISYQDAFTLNYD
ncbi:MAG: DUF4065 domain-containing protein [Muribaculaceae bacterium]|nr:DUF4065 domain-containing protein [Muribaculaceae bacterium]